LQSAYGGGSFDVFVAKLSLSPAVSLSANSLSFGSELVSSTSNAQSVTLTNGGDAALTVSISITGDFEQTNNCGSSVAAGGSCTINVTFTPTAGGNRSGMLTITDNNDGVAGSTQTVNLAGTGQDFTLAPATGSSSSATVSPGGTATYTLTATSVGGFNQAVSLACTGAPSEATCQLSQTSLTPSSSGTNVTVTVTTTAPSVSAPRSRPFPPTRPLTPWPESLVMLALFLSGAAWAAWNWSQPGVSRLRTGSVALALGMLLTLAMAGCGGGGGGKTSNPGTPAGTYTITVTGSTGSGSSALSHSVKLTLTVS
jgi:hypothetical protein